VCLIVDANVAARFLSQPNPVIHWLLGERGNPRLVAAGKLRKELARHADVTRLLVRLEQAGRLRSVEASGLRQEEARLHAAGLCVSNDHHILALAILSGARTLATDDNGLADDFKNARIISRPRGKIYRDPAAHARLLRHTPASCGVQPGDRLDRRGRKGRKT
jgi:hypothetical protein